MNESQFLKSWVLIFLSQCLAFGEAGPPAPASLLPPLSSLGAKKSAPTNPMAPPSLPTPPANTPSLAPNLATAGSNEIDLDPLFDMEDPSTLLDIDEKAMAKLPPPKPIRKPANDKEYSKKLEELALKLLPPPVPNAKPTDPTTTKLNPIPKNDPQKPLIPLLPLLATHKTNTPKFLENKGPTPFLPSPPHPPMIAAMNPPPPPPLNLFPVLGGVGELPKVNREPSGTATPFQPAQVTQRLPVPKTVALPPLPGVPDIAIILSNNQFFPSKIRLRDGVQTRLIFTTTNKKPAALVMERLHIQRWIAKEKEPVPASELDRARWEVNRELSSSKVTEIVLDPKEGTYSFHDAISGASGEIEVEKK